MGSGQAKNRISTPAGDSICLMGRYPQEQTVTLNLIMTCAYAPDFPMKKTAILLTLGLFAAAAFAQTPPARKPDLNISSSDGQSVKAPDDMKVIVTLAPGKTRSIEELNKTEAERDGLKQTVEQLTAAINVLRQQRNELASQVLDLSAQLQQRAAPPRPAEAK